MISLMSSAESSSSSAFTQKRWSRSRPAGNSRHTAGRLGTALRPTEGASRSRLPPVSGSGRRWTHLRVDRPGAVSSPARDGSSRPTSGSRRPIGTPTCGSSRESRGPTRSMTLPGHSSCSVATPCDRSTRCRQVRRDCTSAAIMRFASQCSPPSTHACAPSTEPPRRSVVEAMGRMGFVFDCTGYRGFADPGRR